VPGVFDEHRDEWAQARSELLELAGEDGYAAARRTTINAHYTDPAIVSVIWQTVRELGFDGGRVLEPGCGIGTFIGLAPADAELTGVELDPATARLAQALYPHASVRNESFADTRLPDGHFDLTVGNVPFADVRLHDPQHNPGRHSIHNHFILKSLGLTRPGGLVAVLTSRFTLDAGNPAARREMSQLADLVGAIRLPSGSHRRTAGTDAVMDLVILRRRGAGGEPASDPGWESTRAVDVDGEQIRINAWLAERPEMILGHLAAGRGMYASDTLLVRCDVPLAQLAERLRDAAGTLVAGARARGLTAAARDTSLVDGAGREEVVALAPPGEWDGHIVARADGTFATVAHGAQEPLSVPATQAGELRSLLELRDRARGLLAAEAASLQDTPELAVLRDGLRGAYSAYVQRYGALNRYTLRRTGRVDEDDGEQRMARITPPAVRLLCKHDPFGPLVRALENFDDSTQTASPATLLTERVVAPRAPRLGADTPQDALAICLDTHARVEIEEVARLLGTTPQDAREQLGELVYHDPAAAQLVSAAEYLSGDVRVKLDQARAAAARDTSLQGNVAALERVLPPDLGPEEIAPRLGAAWIDADTHRQFLSELLEDPNVVVEHPGAAIWAVKGRTYTVKAASEWGTGRIDALTIAKAVMEQRPVRVTDEIDVGDRTKRVLNATETAAAQEKADALQQRFGEWCWEDPERTARLTAEYNTRFNSLVIRDYRTAGEHLALPGIARTFTPLPHQRAAVARIVAEPAVGLFHEVGAGKTATIAIAASELKRLGLVNKPAVVVPNHMLEQFSREWLQIFPQSRVLAASGEDLAGDRRRQFVARVAANDWDAVIMTRSAFSRLPVSTDTEAGYERQQVAQLREMLDRAKGDRGLTVKLIEKQIARREQDLKAKLDAPRDPGISFESTGLDYVLCDEAHDFKNLKTDSNIRDASITGSKRAQDLHMKLEYLRSRHGARIATLATATPIANSITEAHVMSRYLRPDLLARAGVEDFDSWAATFGQTVTEIEVDPARSGDYRMHTRFARFTNVPEMLRSTWHGFADVKTAEDLRLPVPELAQRPDGQRAPIAQLIAASPELTGYVQQLGERAEKVRGRSVDPSEDNMLKITGDGRKAALDMQLVTGQPASAPGKLQAAAENIARLYHATRAREYLDPVTGRPSSTPGALQIVFCDLSTPGGEGWNAYDQLRDELVDRGVPADRVRYIHQARDDLEKARLFAACRAGHVNVILGSTQKMGIGTNIQARAIALHHLDAPWRPADIAQRDGRIRRQGNQNSQVGVYRYVTEGSFDTYMWQTLERKARFINQVMRGRLDVREIEDLGDDVIGFAELKAIASGDPLILEKAKIDAEAERLNRVQRAWQRGHHALRSTITAGQERAGVRERQIAAVNQALPRVRDTRGDLFTITINDHAYTHRTDAASALATRLRTVARGPARPVAQLAGLQVDGELLGDQTGEQYLHLTLYGLPAQPATLKRSQLADAGLSLIRQLEHRVQTLPDLAARLDHERIEALRETAAARDQLARPFKYADQLADARRQQERIGEQIAERHHEHQDAERTAAIAGVDADADTANPIAPAAQPTPALAAHGEPPAAGDRDLEPETAESLRLLRATQAKPIEEALRSPAAANPAARNLTHAPPRSSRPRR
jgi:N12 class adenine-specific DNA methylase/SAM-dependent methyltransferase